MLSPTSLSCPGSRSGALSAGAEEGRSPRSKETSFLCHPLVITGEAAGGGALPLPFPTAHAPTLMRATEARITRHVFVIFGDPGRVAGPASLDGYTSATSARTTHPPVNF